MELVADGVSSAWIPYPKEPASAASLTGAFRYRALQRLRRKGSEATMTDDNSIDECKRLLTVIDYFSEHLTGNG
jgi:hypothetical protein